MPSMNITGSKRKSRESALCEHSSSSSTFLFSTDWESGSQTSLHPAGTVQDQMDSHLSPSQPNKNLAHYRNSPSMCTSPSSPGSQMVFNSLFTKTHYTVIFVGAHCASPRTTRGDSSRESVCDSSCMTLNDDLDPPDVNESYFALSRVPGVKRVRMSSDSVGIWFEVKGYGGRLGDIVEAAARRDMEFVAIKV
jgi:hypothetical protein